MSFCGHGLIVRNPHLQNIKHGSRSIETSGILVAALR